MSHWPLLSLVTFVPLIGAGFILTARGDEGTIDRLGPDGVSVLTRVLARRAGRLQTGYVYHYAFAMLIGVVLLISWYLVVRVH